MDQVFCAGCGFSCYESGGCGSPVRSEEENLEADLKPQTPSGYVDQSSSCSSNANINGNSYISTSRNRYCSSNSNSNSNSYCSSDIIYVQLHTCGRARVCCSVTGMFVYGCVCLCGAAAVVKLLLISRR